MSLTQAKRPTLAYKKIQAKHHRKSKHYIRAYWPYLPMFLAILICLVISAISPLNHGVLADTSNFSINSLQNQTNNYRSEIKAQPLILNSTLSDAAQAKANILAKNNVWTHDLPGYSNPWAFIVNQGYDYSAIGENLAYGFSSGDQVVNAWFNSSDHKTNLLNSNFSEVGYGIAESNNFQNKGPEVIIVADYATPSNFESPSYINDSLVQPAYLNVNRLMTLNSTFYWLSIITAVLIGFSIAVVYFQYRKKVNKIAKNSRSIVLSHPGFNLLIITLVVFIFLLTRNTGFIG